MLVVVLVSGGGTTCNVRFAIVEYENASDAQTALDKLHNYMLDKKHKFSIMPYHAFAHLLEVPEEFEERNYPPYEPKVYASRLDHKLNPRSGSHILVVLE